MVCAFGLPPGRTRRLAGWASAVLFVVVFPANVQMAVDARNESSVAQVIAYARLPLQIPLVWWAVAVARSAPRCIGPTSGTGQLISTSSPRRTTLPIRSRSRRP